MENNNLTKQMKKWSGEFGREYTNRNPQNIEEMDQLYLKEIGQTRETINQELIGDLDRDIRILEVGCNVGAQLMILQKMGFKNLCGIELQEYAVECAKERTSGIEIIQGSAFDIPYETDSFEMVFTSGVLIHINPNDLPVVLSEIHRCTRRFIWGFEYYSEAVQEINYRGENELMWKGDYSQLFLDQFSDMSLLQKKIYPYVDNENRDVMYLLERH